MLLSLMTCLKDIFRVSIWISKKRHCTSAGFNKAWGYDRGSLSFKEWQESKAVYLSRKVKVEMSKIFSLTAPTDLDSNKCVTLFSSRCQIVFTDFTHIFQFGSLNVNLSPSTNRIQNFAVHCLGKTSESQSHVCCCLSVHPWGHCKQELLIAHWSYF